MSIGDADGDVVHAFPFGALPCDIEQARPDVGGGNVALGPTARARAPLAKSSTPIPGSTWARSTIRLPASSPQAASSADHFR